MKGIIVDIKGKHAVALSEGGDFVKLSNNGCLRVGCEVDISPHAGVKSGALFRIASIAAVFLLVIGLSVGAYAYGLPYAYINVDINPSVEFTTNAYNMVINAEGLNMDGTEILSSLKYKNRRLERVIEDVLEIAVEEGFIKDNSSNAIMFTVSGKDQERAARIHDKIKSSVEKEVKKINIETEVVVEKVSLKKHDEAKELGISPGKLTLIEKLIEQDPEVKIEEWKDAPVKDIMKSIKDIRKAGKTTQKGISKDGKAMENKTADDKAADDKTADDDNDNDKDNDNGKNGVETGNRDGKKTGKGEGNPGKGNKSLQAEGTLAPADSAEDLDAGNDENKNGKNIKEETGKRNGAEGSKPDGSSGAKGERKGNAAGRQDKR